MVQPGYAATNTSNISIPHGVGFFFKRTGTSTWLNFGILQDVSMTPTAEFLEVTSNHKGINAVAKRILTTRSLAVDATLIEVNLENLRLAFYGGAQTTGSIGVLESEVVKKKQASGDGSSYVLPAQDLLVENDTWKGSLTSLDGSVDYTADMEPAVDPDGLLDTTSAGTDFALLAEDTELLLTYFVQTLTVAGGSNKFELLDTTTIEGVGRFQIRNNKGGLAQIYEFDNIQIAPNGAIPTPQDAVQAIPLTMTAQETSGMFGRVFFRNIASA